MDQPNWYGHVRPMKVSMEHGVQHETTTIGFFHRQPALRSRPPWPSRVCPNREFLRVVNHFQCIPVRKTTWTCLLTYIYIHISNQDISISNREISISNPFPIEIQHVNTGNWPTILSQKNPIDQQHVSTHWPEIGSACHFNSDDNNGILGLSYAICEPWCWYIYLHNWVILFGQILVNIPAPWFAYGYGESSCSQTQKSKQSFTARASRVLGGSVGSQKTFLDKLSLQHVNRASESRKDKACFG